MGGQGSGLICVSEKFASVEDCGWEAVGRVTRAKSRFVGYSGLVSSDTEESPMRGKPILQRKEGYRRMGLLSQLGDGVQSPGEEL